MDKVTRRALAGAAPAAAAMAIGVGAAEEASAQGLLPSFDWVVTAYVGAIQTRNLAALERTLTSGEDLIFILPNGELKRTRAEYVNFHRQWFGMTTWSIEFQELWRQVSISIGQVLYRTRYTDVNDDGSSYETRNHRLLTFQRDTMRWKLLTDHNTRMPSSPG
jgi:ketosteroid isomerase-like protein